MMLSFLSFAQGEPPAAATLKDTVLELKTTPVSAVVTFPAVKVPEGQKAILRARIFYKFRHGAGWSNGLKMKLNGTDVERYNDEGEERLLRRGTAMKVKFDSGKTSSRDWYNPSQGWLTYYGSGKSLDYRITFPKEEGYWFSFDVTDLINQDQENKLNLTATRNLAEMNFTNKPFHFVDAKIILLPADEVEKVRPQK